MTAAFAKHGRTVSFFFWFSSNSKKTPLRYNGTERTAKLIPAFSRNVANVCVNLMVVLRVSATSGGNRRIYSVIRGQ